jgi:putative Mg2+ transporter-C (MgtC) family protein
VSPEAQVEVLTRVIVALLLGAIVGIEREYRGHPAGVRTLAMVSVGSCIFTAAGLFLYPGHTTDPTRIAAQVVTGVGFLGAGAIFRSDDGVKGLTTAATVWVVAAIGMATGFGLYLIAAGGALLVLIALALIRPIELRFLHRSDHPMRRHDDELAGGEPPPHR